MAAPPWPGGVDSCPDSTPPGLTWTHLVALSASHPRHPTSPASRESTNPSSWSMPSAPPALPKHSREGFHPWKLNPGVPRDSLCILSALAGEENSIFYSKKWIITGFCATHKIPSLIGRAGRKGKLTLRCGTCSAPVCEAPLGEVHQHSHLREQREGKHRSERIHVSGSGAIPGWGPFPAGEKILLLFPPRQEFRVSPEVFQQSRLSPFLPKAADPLGDRFSRCQPTTSPAPPIPNWIWDFFSSQIG